MHYLPNPSLLLTFIPFPPPKQQLHLSPIISAWESPEMCEDYNSQSVLPLPPEQGRMGTPCLQRAFPLAKERRVGGGLLARPSPLSPGTGFQLLPGCPALHSPVIQVDGVGRRRERAGSPFAWVLEVPGDGAKHGSGKAPRAEKCGRGIIAPPPSCWRAPGSPFC